MADLTLGTCDGTLELRFADWEFTQGESEDEHEWLVDALERKIADKFGYDDVHVLGYTIEPSVGSAIDATVRETVLSVEARVMSR